MKISKTNFMNFIRCNRYIALHELAYKRGEALVLFYDDDLTIENLYSTHQNAKKDELIQSLFDNLDFDEDSFDDEEFDPLNKPDELHKLLLGTYSEIEKLTAAYIKNLFGGKIVFGTETFEQKYFDIEVDEYKFFAFLDGFQEDEKCVRIIESKATTSNKFLNIGYKIKGVFNSVFIETAEGILKLRHELGAEIVDEKKYYDKLRTLYDKYSDCGKYIYDLAYQRFIVEKSHRSTKEHQYYLSILNTNYRFDGSYHKNGTQNYNPNDCLTLVDLTSVTQIMMTQIENEMKVVSERLNTMNANSVSLDKCCQIGKGHRECKFKNVCFKDKNIPEKNSLYVYLYGHHGFVDSKTNDKYLILELLNDGIVEYDQIPREWLKPKQKIQYDCIKFDETHMDKELIKAGINDLKYPLYHLDFESFNAPLPRYKGEKPYQQSLFQFSLHVEKTPGVCDKELDNFGYLADTHDDIREELVKKMIECIKQDDGNVIVYNKAFEATRIKELISFYPQYKNELEDINRRMFDLLHLVKGNEKLFINLGFDENRAKNLPYYDKYLQRSYSIKKVLPIFVPELSYDNLNEVHNGTEAQLAYLKLATLEASEKAELYRNMLEYCKQDTWAMVEILKGLRNLVN